MNFEYIGVLTHLKHGFGKNFVVKDLIEIVWLERIGLERIRLTKVRMVRI